MKVSGKIFKGFDIRGLVDTELSTDFFYSLGRAALVYTGAKEVYVGYDMRPSSIPFAQALMRGLVDQGASVTNIGLISTPMLNIMTIRDPAAQLGIMITASHNPEQYNGCKFINKKTMMPIGMGSGLEAIQALVECEEFIGPSVKGSVKEMELRGAYLDTLFSLVDVSIIKPLKIVIDMGNGIEGVLIDEFMARLPVKAHYLFKEPDGRFPNHEANPLKHETLKDLQKKIIEVKADMGFAYDGDADRIGLVDETGAIIPGDIILALLTPSALAAHPGATVCYDLRSSWAVKETIVQHGGQPLECPVGRTLIIETMRRTKAALGGELSCHFYFSDLEGFESGDFALLHLLKLLSESGKKLSELVSPLRRYFHSGEINFTVADKAGAIARVESTFGHGAISVSHLDGIKLEFIDWWLNVRASNTEPLLRLTLEAKTLELMAEKIKGVKEIIEASQ